MPNAATHPTPQELAAFSQGKLPASAAQAVAAHLETCPACQQAIEKMTPDSFVGKVRAARSATSALPARPALAGDSPSLLPNRAAVSAPPADLPPALAGYGKFRFMRELGRGGMGVVYQAEQTVMGRIVAVKVINPSVLAHPEALPRFQAEVRAAAKLDHPNIVRAFDAEQVGELHLLVMEFVEGKSLAELVQQKGALAIPYACHYVRQAALGLQHAFEQGMVHRDIKPQNLMVNDRGQVKVLDFGLARLRSERKQGGGLTQVDAFMGTPEYVSPEQATDARSADTRADIYSLGCTLFYLLTGHPPFPGETVVQIILAQIEKEAPPLHQARPDVPAELSAVVARMLAKDPAQRFQQPIEVAQVLAAFVKAGPKRDAGAGASVASNALSPGSGTVIAARSSRIKPVKHEASAGIDATSPFENLVDTADTPKNGGRPGELPGLMPVLRKRWLVGSVLAGLALLIGLWAAGVFKVKKDRMSVQEDQPPAATAKPAEKPQKPRGERSPVDRAVEKGVAALRRMQRATGDWPNQQQPMGATALAGLTLLECGVANSDPAVARAADFVREASFSCNFTYSLSLAILFLDRLGDPDDIPMIESLTVRLLGGQNANGGWSYFCPLISDAEKTRLKAHLALSKERVVGSEPSRSTGLKRTFRDLPKAIQQQWTALDQGDGGRGRGTSDNSNTQFAALGLWAGRRQGVPVEKALARVESRFRTGQNADGGWGYHDPARAANHSTPSMTCAGLLSLIVGTGAALETARERDPSAKPRDLNKDPIVRKSVLALASILDNPTEPPNVAPGATKSYYFLWSLERVAMILDLETIGKTDWYHWGTELLLSDQRPDGSWTNGDYGGSTPPTDTCLALHFLKRTNLVSDLTAQLKGPVKAPR
jgi:hypothetical protein